MKKIIYLMIALVFLIFAMSALPGYAHGGGYYGHGGYYGGGGYYGHGGYYGGGHWSGSIYIGPGWWGPWGYPSYPYPYPYYTSPPAVIQQQSPVYEQQAPQEEQQYWYFCSDSKTYYPYVKQCPGGWMKVVPTPTTPPK